MYELFEFEIRTKDVGGRRHRLTAKPVSTNVLHTSEIIYKRSQEKVLGA